MFTIIIVVQIIYKNDWNNNNIDSNNIDSNCNHGYDNDNNNNDDNNNNNMNNNILDRGIINEIRRKIVIAIKHSNVIDIISNGNINVSAIIIIKINLKSW